MAEFSIDRTLDRRLAAHRTVAWQHGIVGGLVASVVMALVLMVAMAINGRWILPAARAHRIHLVWGRYDGHDSHPRAGFVTHLAVAVLFGAIWAYTFSYVKVEPLLSGLVYGAVLWAGDAVPGAASHQLHAQRVDGVRDLLHRWQDLQGLLTTGRRTVSVSGWSSPRTSSSASAWERSSSGRIVGGNDASRRRH